MTGRFAPTPSGRMHIGNIYAMLGAWLSARSRGERMMMRIEDVDGPRVVAGADRLMMDDLHWLGLDWDGEPMFQSRRAERYEHALECLRSQGVLYPCFCSRADIRAASAPNEGDGFTVYPGTCRRLLREHPEQVRARLARGDRHSIRIAMPEETFAFTDGVYGPRRYDLAREVGDCVIRRADGLFGYQLAVVVDDLDMGVDDIVRGRDLLRSTALQARIRRCLLEGGFEPEHGGIDPCAAGRPASRCAARPAYAHLPLIDNAAGRRLAKRERSLDMGALRARGVRPEQIIGYCAWLLRLQPDSIACSPADLLADFSWTPLRGAHDDRILDPASPHTPAWLAEAL
ncbi:glutamyl-Q tRNA(Asp) synthetase [Bifidobacterium longum subsp. infantis]|uniref:Glutamyl-Q tRNA(Asp) synthetase n=1 Tax=Bifidobacterium longum subsp. infantis TaxID=1682 RepID=A0A0M3T5W8_BIFLI|nr:glutamyl-Q tRNA(Asp) synthetase [Bifidobacterium longum]ALE08575.1 Glutamyl-Q tRNA(Asp) synthetase [Bifidobacterium longum subsp. infantis]OQM69084.1 Glutamyl-Q tRNA(Asp) synthetase [Bifidobacterium longum subsp. infantis]